MENENTLLFNKRFTCPVCQNEFITKMVKSGKAKFVNTDIDLRPVYENVDTLKYDAILCPKCGYAALERYFDTLSPVQKSNIETKVSQNFSPRTGDPESYTYEIALERYKLALLSSMVKVTASSELGYVCLKISWLLQSQAKWLEKEEPENTSKIVACQKEAHSYSKKALDSLSKARMEEDYPICGMDEATLDYLLAALYYKADQLDSATRYLGTVAASREANGRLKDKAYDLKTLIAERNKELAN